MDPRGPPEGAPDDPLEISNIDKGDKTNNRLLFLTVEYVEEQSRDYTRMFPSLEPVAFSSRTSSPLSDFEHRVSPHDPNMSSAARYSPTPVQLPPSPFHNSVVVLQGPSSPLVCNSEASTRTNVNYITHLMDQTTSQNIPQEDNAGDYVNSGNEEALVSCVEGELILMQTTNPELEASAAPLMLTGITGTDFTLTRDFLVMHDEQLNVVNSMKNQNGELNNGRIIGTSETLNSSKMDDSQLKSSTKNQIREDRDVLLDSMKVENSEKKNTKKSKKVLDIEDEKPFWCNECDSICVNVNGCITHNVRAIADQPVPARAIATLPGSYLTIYKLPPSDILDGGFEYAVFAKRFIQKRTQFGPVEGILTVYNGAPFKNALPLLYEEENGEFMRVDVSNENTSNWMRFVRPAFTYKEQNLVICQQNDGIVFLSVRDIFPKEELKAGPHPEYARRRNLPVLEQVIKTEKESNKSSNTWSCFKCNEHFLTSDKLQKHLKVHERSKLNEKVKSKHKKDRIVTSKFFKVVDGHTLLYTCPHCLKVFPRSYSLKRHLLIHPGAKIPRYECSMCNESFLHPHTRNRHVKMCHNARTKEKENSKQNASEWRCTSCSATFRTASLLEVHKLIHVTGKDIVELKQKICSQCSMTFEKQNDLVVHVSQHAVLSKSRSLNTLAPYKCSRCYKRFATKVRLQQHCLVHGAEDQKPLPCNICLKRFMNNSALSCHLKTHRKEKQAFECPICKKLFEQILMLKDHIETHRNEDNSFDCPHCFRTFGKYSIIRKHIRAHHCERTHKCHFCSKRFPTVDKLRMHLLRHSDYKEFQCANCDKQFKRKDKLKEHMTRMHTSPRMNKEKTLQSGQTKKFVPKINPTDYNRFVYKCHQCLVGFKRRGMLVNHLAKRHPEVSPESVPELNLPILRQTRDYYCQYCDKVYKSSSKRKAHIMKNHPGAALPPSNRQKEAVTPGLPNPTFSQTVGSITTTPQSCQWCHKQYASKAKLLQHQRKKHATLMEPADQIPRPRNRPPPNQNQPPLGANALVITDYIQTCDMNTEFLKPKVIKISDDVDLISKDLDIVDQQFGRMRDIR